VNEHLANLVIHVPRLWTALILIAALFGPAQTASASCGHYVHIDQIRDIPPVERTGLPPAPACDGPTCQRREHTPPAPPVPAPSVTREQALLALLSPGGDETKTRVSDTGWHYHPIHHWFPPERPPRA
jgi:hypothetical protein